MDTYFGFSEGKLKDVLDKLLDVLNKLLDVLNKLLDALNEQQAEKYLLLEKENVCWLNNKVKYLFVSV